VANFRTGVTQGKKKGGGDILTKMLGFFSLKFTQK
jgi:hypothetical protein